MPPKRSLSSRPTDKKALFKPHHSEPEKPFLDYILLPYGAYYDKTRGILDAKKGDILRFFNGPEYPIDTVQLLPSDKFCDILCRMRYGVKYEVAFRKWLTYARMEGHGKDILSKDYCILVVYDKSSV